MLTGGLYARQHFGCLMLSNLIWVVVTVDYAVSSNSESVLHPTVGTSKLTH